MFSEVVLIVVALCMTDRRNEWIVFSFEMGEGCATVITIE